MLSRVAPPVVVVALLHLPVGLAGCSREPASEPDGAGGDRQSRAVEEFDRASIESLPGAPGVVVPLESPYVSAAARAIEQGFGRAPVFIREGGSIPVVSTFHEKLGVDTLLLGWGQNDDNTHSPNEKFCLADYHKGIKASAYLWKELSSVRGQ